MEKIVRALRFSSIHPIGGYSTTVFELAQRGREENQLFQSALFATVDPLSSDMYVEPPSSKRLLWAMSEYPRCLIAERTEPAHF